MSGQALADRIGVTRATVWRWENGQRKIHLDELQRVSTATGISASILRPDLASMLANDFLKQEEA